MATRELGLRRHTAEYMDKISRVELLTREDEIDLAIKIRTGVEVMSRLEGCPRDVLPPQTELELLEIDDGSMSEQDAEAIRVAYQARNDFIEANLRLVVFHAKYYHAEGAELLDVIQEGNRGLMRAVDLFDHTKGFKFSTYASSWIRQAITRGAVNKSSLISISDERQAQLRSLRSISNAWLSEHGKEPTATELSQFMGINEERVVELQSYRQVTSVAYLDEDADEYRATLAYSIGDDSALKAISTVEDRELVLHLLDNLSDDERTVISLRFGLLGEEVVQSLSKIGRQLGRSTDWVRLRELKAMEKLRQQLIPESDNSKS